MLPGSCRHNAVENNKLPKQERLSGRKRIGTLFSDGSSGFVYPFKYMLSVSGEARGTEYPASTVDNISDHIPQAGVLCGHGKSGIGGDVHIGGVSILVSVPKKNHKRAVKRNKVRRRTREAFRLAKHGLSGKAFAGGKQVDLALIYVSKDIEEYKTIENAVGKLLAQIAENI